MQSEESRTGPDADFSDISTAAREHLGSCVVCHMSIWSKTAGMVSRGKSRDRIEPSFEEEREDEDLRLDADDQIAGGRKARSAGKRSAPTARSNSGKNLRPASANRPAALASDA